MTRDRIALGTVPAFLVGVLLILHQTRGPLESARYPDSRLEPGAASFVDTAVQPPPSVAAKAREDTSTHVLPAFPIIEVPESNAAVDIGDPILVEEISWSPSTEIVEIGERLNAGVHRNTDVDVAVESTPMTIGEFLDADQPVENRSSLQETHWVSLGEPLDADVPDTVRAIESGPLEVDEPTDALPWR